MTTERPAPDQDHPAPPLTPRQQAVAALVIQGLSNRQIAAALGLSERTVEFHVRRILKQHNLANRTQFVRWALGARDRPP